jgi:hypothetical protein
MSVGDVVYRDGGLEIVEVAPGTEHSFDPGEMKNNGEFFRDRGCKKGRSYGYRFAARTPPPGRP